MLNRADYLVTYDKELGVIYAPKKKAVKTTTSAHAKAIKECLDNYFSNSMCQEDMEKLEGYLGHSFENDPDLPIMEYPDLMNTNRIRRLEIMVANECNLNCRYCYANGGNYGEVSQRMTPTMAVTFLEAFLSNRYDEVDVVMFFGGEPTLCPDTISTVCDFFNKGVASGRFKKLPDYTMVSNGTLIDEKMAKIIAQNKIRITISIDGPQEINDVLRVDKGGNGTFYRIEKGIRELKKQNRKQLCAFKNKQIPLEKRRKEEIMLKDVMEMELENLDIACDEEAVRLFEEVLDDSCGALISCGGTGANPKD